MLRSVVLGVLTLSALASCRVTERLFSRDELPLYGIERENAELHVLAAREEIDRGELLRAIERLIAVREEPNLPPEVRLESEGLIDRAASLQLERVGSSISDLEDLWQLKLSPRMRARAGVRLAEELYLAGHRVSAFQQIRDVEYELPNHPEGAEAGRVLARTGLDLIEDQGRYYLFLRYATRGAAALELLVLTYPLDPSCDVAYAALARHYERDDELELAIARNEDLIYYHPRSPLAVISEAEIPRLRLKLIDEDDHDRGEVVRALEEARAWLGRHADHALAPKVRETELACHRALARSDLVLARYYERIDNEYGARMHARRALTEAQSASSDGLIREAQALLTEYGPEPAAPGPAQPTALEPAPR